MSGQLLDGFTKLNDITSIYLPSKSGKDSKPSGPSLIVYCAWMGAATKHMGKYIQGYKHLYPNASILLIESTLPNMFVGSDVTAACEVIEWFTKNSSSRSTDTEQPYIILHACSNGGANNATWLAARLLKANSRLPFSRVILDCCPGRGEPKPASEAASMSLPKQTLIRLFGFWLFYSTFIVASFFYAAFGLEDAISRIRRTLNDADVFSTQRPRLYLYSDNDALVKWQHVHEHAEDARRKGFSVHEEKFSRAAHAALLIEDSERYWGAVREHLLEKKE